MLNYVAKDFSYLLGLEDFSVAMLKNHFTLYQGYVTNTNKLSMLLTQLLREGKVSTPEYAELKRRFGWEFDGMRLHEYYFENLGGKTAVNGRQVLGRAMARNFGSYEAWERDFQATGAIRGIGWVVLYQEADSGKLINCWINEHDQGHLTGLNPILVMDVWEHAYMLDYGLERNEYIAAFFRNIDWKVVAARLML